MDKSSYLFSIIVPIYKTEKYLSECIDSVLEQEFQNYEIVLVDDGSPDKCPQICDYYASKYSNIICIHKENGGLSDARNAGIINAKGEWLLLLDSDDKLCSQDALANMSEIIGKIDEPVIFCPNMIYFKGNFCKCQGNFPKNIDICSPILLYKLCKKGKIKFCAPLFITKRDFVVKNALFFKQGILHEDLEWIPRILLLTNRISILHISYYSYRQNDNSIMHNFCEKNVYDLIGIIEYYINSNQKYSVFYSKMNVTIISYWLAMIFFFFVSFVLPNIRHMQLIKTFKRKILFLSKVLLYGYGYKNLLLYVYLKIFKVDITLYTLKLINTVKKKYDKIFTS
jgi:glycosyltransferase involved in cell wall biosynthesis